MKRSKEKRLRLLRSMESSLRREMRREMLYEGYIGDVRLTWMISVISVTREIRMIWVIRVIRVSRVIQMVSDVT